LSRDRSPTHRIPNALDCSPVSSRVPSTACPFTARLSIQLTYARGCIHLSFRLLAEARYRIVLAVLLFWHGWCNACGQESLRRQESIASLGSLRKTRYRREPRKCTIDWVVCEVCEVLRRCFSGIRMLGKCTPDISQNKFRPITPLMLSHICGEI